MNPADIMRAEAARLRQLAELEEAHARALFARVKSARQAAKALDASADTVQALAQPSAAADYLGPERAT